MIYFNELFNIDSRSLIRRDFRHYNRVFCIYGYQGNNILRDII